MLESGKIEHDLKISMIEVSLMDYGQSEGTQTWKKNCHFHREDLSLGSCSRIRIGMNLGYQLGINSHCAIPVSKLNCVEGAEHTSWG